ncbi:hypothetical protein HNY73_018387 [Argiope bruennichi]|uniref:Uncharacterized protein n=1 Tax=Argiope bruennichi TaxID=94029 RepID=A0A8T0EE29_ARGBR|nr:hypothetical protein HNY73_018387 [Argiope bruennichi]
MPEDEQQFLKICSEEMGLSTSDSWSDIFVGICSQDNPAQTSFDLISCWDDKRNATLDQIQDDKIYPYEHFMCKLNIFKEAVGKTDCSCKTEKGFDCDVSPNEGTKMG